MIESIDKYEARVDRSGKVHWYGIRKKDKKEFPIPDQFASMCNDNYLAVSETDSEMPEVLGLSENKYFIPRMTE